MTTDTPLPPDEPMAPNPPEGATIDYYLKSAATGPVTLEITRSDGRLVRRYSSTDPVPALPTLATSPLPLYWYRLPRGLSADAGMHRFTWDVHHQPLGAGGGGRGGGGLPMTAVPYDTAPAPTTPWVAPGRYTVTLTVDGKKYTQPITVKNDPRVRTPASVMQQVYTLSEAAYYGAIDAQAAATSLGAMRQKVAQLQPKAQGEAARALAAFDAKAEALLRGGGAPGAAAVAGERGAAAAGGPGGTVGAGRGAATAGGRGAGGSSSAGAAETLSSASSALAGVMNSLQAADVQPTANQLAAIANARALAARVMARWQALSGPDLAALNTTLKAAGMEAVK